MAILVILSFSKITLSFWKFRSVFRKFCSVFQKSCSVFHKSCSVFVFFSEFARKYQITPKLVKKAPPKSAKITLYTWVFTFRRGGGIDNYGFFLNWMKIQILLLPEFWILRRFPSFRKILLSFSVFWLSFSRFTAKKNTAIQKIWVKNRFYK